MILVVGNVKGDVGKTTLAVNLAIALARGQRDILLIDGDEQGTAIAFTDLRTAEKGDPVIPLWRFAGPRSEHRSGSLPRSIRTSSLT